MSGVNKVILIGNLGKDPEVRYLENGTAVCTISLATTENYSDRSSGERKQVTDWHNVVLWRGLAEIASKYLVKGSQVYIEGKLTSRSYQDQQGQTKYITEVVARDLTMLGGPRKENSQYNASAVQANTASDKVPSVTTVNEPTPEMSSTTSEGDDLPF